LWIKKDLLGLRDTTKEELLQILSLAKDMKPIIDNKKDSTEILKNKSIVTLFYENSTRTKMSFTLAGKYLGATVTDLGISTSSVNKGESLIDTGVTLDQMGIDTVIIRHGNTAAPHLLAKNINASVVSGGDGTNEHPTQALLDMYTILEEKGGFEGLKVAIIGDIAHSRVARSNVFGLNKLGANVVLAGPSTLTPKNMTVLGAKVTNNIKEAVENADVVMGLRVQLERQKGGLFPDLREYSHMFGVDNKLLSLARKDVLVMHPGPVNRGVELTSNVIDGKHSLINRQVKNGVAVRMAILALLNEAKDRN
jgi:aspartate carbamoyltransferase catalytic subunit